MSKLELAPNFYLPIDAVTESIGILAVKRAGKSHTAKKFAEQLFYAGQQIVIIDPKGDWWGIRSSADGRSAGLPIVIVGGEHADVPLEVNSGELVARMIVEDRVSMLIDLSELRKEKVPVFMSALLETLYHLKAKDQYRTPLMLIIDEADAIAPQKAWKGHEERMLGAAEDIVRRGGQRGIGITLVTQRAAVLNKNVLTQVGILVLLRTTGSQDIEAVDVWIKKHGQPEERKQVIDSIASMERGTAWIWAPGWPTPKGIFRQVQIGPIDTFDSGATPKAGQKRKAPKTLADVDLNTFRTKMADTIERAKANDPVAIKKQLDAVTKELAVERKKKLPAAAPSPASIKPIIDEEAISKAVHIAVEKERKETKIFLTKVFTSLNFLSKSLKNESDSVGDALVSITNYLDVQAAKLIEVPKVTIKIAKRQAAAPALPASTTTAAVQATRQPTIKSDGDLRIPEGVQKMLDTLAVIDGGLDAKSLGGRVGISNKRSTFRAHIAFANKHGLITGNRSGYTITDAGRSYASETAAPLSGEELIEYWINKLSLGAGKALRILVDAGQALDRMTLAERIEVDPSKSTFRAILAELRVYDLIGGSDEIHAADHLFT